MADLNEPKKETGRLDLPAPAEAKKPPTGSLRPPPAAPRPLPSKEEVAGGLRPPPGYHPTHLPAPVAPGPPGLSKPGLPPINRPLENRELIQAGPWQKTGRVDSPLKAATKLGGVQRSSAPLAPLIRAASPRVANSSAKGLGALAPAQLCWRSEEHTSELQSLRHLV